MESFMITEHSWGSYRIMHACIGAHCMTTSMPEDGPSAAGLPIRLYDEGHHLVA